MSFVISTNDSL